MAFYDLVPYVLTYAILRTEFARLCQLTKADQKIVERLTRLLNSPAEIASLHRLIHLATDILLNSSGCVFHTLSLRTCEAKLVHNGNCLSCKTKGKGLYLLVSCFPVEARQAEVGVPLGPPCFEVGAPVHLQVEFQQVPLPKRERHSTCSGHSSDWKALRRTMFAAPC